MGLKQGQQALEQLGLCDYQVSGNLKSSNEGAQLYLLIGANRKSVPEDTNPQVEYNAHPRPCLLQQTVRAIVACHGGTVA